MSQRKIVGDVVGHYLRHARGRRAILFAVSTAASVAMAKRFCDAGVRAAHVGAETPALEREALVKAHAAGKIKVLCNVELFTEGFDVPDIGAVILLRPTKSLALSRQMIGRVLRPTVDKRAVVILDHANLFSEHGAPDDDYAWSLDGEPPVRRSPGSGTVRYRRCPECTAVFPWSDKCPDCGHFLGNDRRAPEQLDGDLYEIGGSPGLEDIKVFALRVGINVKLIHSWKSRSIGFPCVRRGRAVLVRVEAAKRWLENESCQFRRSPPPDLVTIAEFARSLGFRKEWGYVCKKRGLPTDTTGKFVDPVAGTAWVDAMLESRKKRYAENLRRQQLADPGMVERSRIALRAASKDPGYREKVARGIKKFWADPAREADRQAFREAIHIPEVRKRAAATRRKTIASDPALRQKLLDGLARGRQARWKKKDAAPPEAP